MTENSDKMVEEIKNGIYELENKMEELRWDISNMLEEIQGDDVTRGEIRQWERIINIKNSELKKLQAKQFDLSRELVSLSNELRK